MYVNFSYADEFLAELRLDAGFAKSLNVPRGLVRLTVRRKPMQEAPLRAVIVLASYVNGHGEIVRLQQYMGESAGGDFDTKLNVEVKKVLEQVETAVKGLGLTVRAGIYEDGGGK